MPKELVRLSPLKDIKDVLGTIYTPQEMAKLGTEQFIPRTYKQIRQDYMDGKITHEEASRQLFKTHWQSDVIELLEMQMQAYTHLLIGTLYLGNRSVVAFELIEKRQKSLLEELQLMTES